jgi:ISXO2-like transposase domain
MAKNNIRQPFSLRYTFKDFERDFPTEETCLRWLLGYLYPKGIHCKRCKKLTRHHLLPSRMKAYHLPDNKKPTILKPLCERVLRATVIFTDYDALYGELKWLGYEHKRINHLAKIYADGRVHTQTIEGFWSLLKRGN